MKKRQRAHNEKHFTDIGKKEDQLFLVFVAEVMLSVCLKGTEKS